MSRRIRLLIADDHKMVREGLKAFILPIDDMEVVGEAGDGIEATELAIRLTPDVVLLDLMMPGLDGIEATKKIRNAIPSAKILIITSFAEDEKIISAIKAGAMGYLLKDSSPAELENAIREIDQGDTALPARMIRMLMVDADKENQTTQDIPLTDREVDILKLVAQGYSNQEIANELVLSIWTVRAHITNILNKLHLENRTQVALYALRSGLVKL